MIKINKVNNSLTVEGVDNVFYPNNGDNSYPLNSLIIVIDDSNMATFRSVATNDVLFSGLIEDITINGEAVTKDNIITKFDAVSNSTSTGGGGGSVDAYTKTESDAKYATKNELTAVETVANDADTKVDALTPRVEGVETAMDDKQDTLVSGTNIKTINSQSILGSGDLAISGVSEEQAQEIAKIPTLETELAQKANASDVPTVQTDYDGNGKTYIYSNPDEYMEGHWVIAGLDFQISTEGKLNLRSFPWGDKNKTFIYSLTVPSATTTAAGVMSAADKTKLDSIPETIPSQSEIDGIAADVSALETDMMGKQPTLVSGTNIKTINGNSILGEGNLVIEGGDTDLSNYYTKTETDTKLDAKQNTLVSGTNIKTINGESVLGEGNIVIEGSGITEEQAQEIAKIPTLETSLNNKQDTLVSGTNIKTVNSQSILGEGNLEVRIPDATTATSGAMSAADKTKLDSLSTEWTGTQSEFDALTTKEDNIIYYVTE